MAIWLQSVVGHSLTNQMALIDTHGRHIKYLRLSVTDRCNLRCQYCMPVDGVTKLRHQDVLSYESLHLIASEAVGLGIDKIRLTGGEPLVRKGIVAFAERLAAIPGLRELVLTTNGLLLPELATSLRNAGVNRLNVSLDSLKPEVFAGITRGGDLTRVLEGLSAAKAAGFPPPKINVVVMRGINDSELLDFAGLAARTKCSVRFIEYMPTRGAQDWHSLAVMSSEILNRVREYYRLTPIKDDSTSQPSRNFRIEGSTGTIGIISPLSQHFCGTCDRIRITATGLAKGCLFGTGAVDLKPYLAGDGAQLRDVLSGVITDKPVRHHLTINSTENTWVAMSQIGG